MTEFYDEFSAIDLPELTGEKTSQIDASHLIADTWKSLSKHIWTEDQFDQDSVMPYLFQFDKKINGEIVNLEVQKFSTGAIFLFPATNTKDL